MLALYFPLGSLWDNYVTEKVGEEPAGLPAYSMYVGFNPETNGEYSTEDSQLLESYRMTEGSAKAAQEHMLEELKIRLNTGKINFPKLFITKLGTLLGFDDGGAYYMKEWLTPTAYTVLVIISNIYYYGLLMLTLLGAVRLFKKAETSCAVMLPMYVLGLALAHMLVEIAARYHYSVIPMLVMIAAFSLESGETAKNVNFCQS